MAGSPEDDRSAVAAVATQYFESWFEGQSRRRHGAPRRPAARYDLVPGS